MIKLVCSDIDGTLLNNERRLSKTTISEIEKLNLPVVLISARMPSAMKYLQKQLKLEHYPIVAYNGGLICKNDEVKQSTTIAFELTKEIVQLNSTSLHLSLYHNDDWFVPEDDKWTKREINNTQVTPTIKPNAEVIKEWGKQDIGAHKIMCMGEANLVDEFYDLLANKMPDDLHLYKSKDTYIEIVPKSISKRSAIEFLISSEFDLEMKEVMSFGDNYNDIEMLEASGLGLAVGNARDEVKKAANKVIGNAKEDGVAKFLNSYFKGE